MPSADPNLLAWTNGTVVRQFPTQLSSPSPDLFTGGLDGWVTGQGPFVIVFELPGTASITSFSALLVGGDTPSSLDFAIASDGANGSYRDLGTLTGSADNATKTLNVTASGRWVRVTAKGDYQDLIAIGTLQPPPQPLLVAGTYAENPDPYSNGTFVPRAQPDEPYYRRVVAVGRSMSATECSATDTYSGNNGIPYPGILIGRNWSYRDVHGQPATAVVNDEASLIVGSEEGGSVFLMRTTLQPKACIPAVSGSGPHPVLILDQTNAEPLWPAAQITGVAGLAGFSFERIQASLLDGAALNGKETTVFNMLCDDSQFLSSDQAAALLAWVAAGNKLLIVDSDECPNSQYHFLPYPFTTSNPGAQSKWGGRLVLVEDDALGTSDQADATHYFDPKTYAGQETNQLGDANVVTTQDPHWCGHLVTTNTNNVSGFVQMYSVYGQGVIIYDGFDEDDADVAGYQRLRSLELSLPVPGALPCSQPVAAGFVVEPAQDATFKAGVAQTLRFNLAVLANLGWKGHVALNVAGTLPATVTPTSVDVSGPQRPLEVAVSIPASAQPTVYTVNVAGTDGTGHTSTATITLTGTAPLKVTIKKNQHIPIYGIHFDVDSAHIQPQSESIIKEIAHVMDSNPTMHFRIEGHTDSDGGAAYNLGLSQRRAQSVVDDLVHRYHVSRTRLTAQGFGLTEPVAPNTTPANKARNRRVELVAL